TGITFQLGYLKLYQILKEAAPKVVRAICLYDPESSTHGVEERMRSEAQTVNVMWQSVALRNDPNGVAQAFAEFGRGKNGLLLDNSTPTVLKAGQICGLALQHRIPVVGRDRRFADAGCLMSYAEDQKEMYRRAAGYVDRILKGAKPADLPVEQPTKFEMVFYIKTAKAVGLNIQQYLLLTALYVSQ